MARLDANVGDSTRGAKSEERRRASSVERRAADVRGQMGKLQDDDYEMMINLL